MLGVLIWYDPGFKFGYTSKLWMGSVVRGYLGCHGLGITELLVLIAFYKLWHLIAEHSLGCRLKLVG